MILGLMSHAGNTKANKMNSVKNCEWYELSPYVQTHKSACHSIVDNGRGCATPVLSQSLYTYGTAKRRSFMFGWVPLVLQVPQGWREGAQVRTEQVVGLHHSWGTLGLEIPTLLLWTVSKPACPLLWKETLIIPVRQQPCPHVCRRCWYSKALCQAIVLEKIGQNKSQQGLY